ncbi:MAG: double zinc ribbon domain-containing protein [Treponema sp.]|nr:double zinc ribbon domain-containing protein [Treponema sp.]
MKDSQNSIRRSVFFLREYFFPSGCAVCGVSLLSPNEAWYGLCEDCHAELDEETDWLREGSAERCDLCGKPLISEQSRCLSCRSGGERGFDRLVVLFPYTGKYRELFGAYKFDKNIALGHFFTEKIREALEQFSEDAPVIVPVPSRPGKIKKTGWDQVEYLVRLLEREKHRQKNFLISRCLKRLPSKIQKELNRENRLKNLQGRIALVKKAPPQAVIIDDVITTGSTMDVCAAVLKAGGCRKVYGICLVYD